MINVSYQPRRVNFGWINESFQLFLRDAWIWILAIILVQVCAGVLNFGVEEAFKLTGHALTEPLSDPLHPTLPMFYHTLTPYYWADIVVQSLVNLPLTAFFAGGQYKMANKSVRGQRLDLTDIFSGGPTVLSFLLFNFAFLIAFNLGLIFVIVGAFVVSGLLLPAGGLLAVGESFPSAVKSSFNAMKRDWLSAAAFSFVFGCLMVGSVLACCVPILITVSMGLIISSLCCRDMVAGEAPNVEVQEYIAPPGSWPPPPNMNIGTTQNNKEAGAAKAESAETEPLDGPGEPMG